MNNLKEPKHFLILRILGFVLLIVSIALIVMGFVFRVGNADMINFALFVPGIFLFVITIPCLIMGFAAKIQTMEIESTRYIQQANKDKLTEILKTSADISSQAITTTTKSVKRGFKDTKICKHCGAEIDVDSKFCNNCGKEQ